MRIGIDLDNTIVNYDPIFLSVAEQWQLVPGNFSGAKRKLRDLVRNGPDGELQWQRLQGHVYGKQMAKATLFPGVAGFFQQCRRVGATVYIVSHKTELAHHDIEHTNLRQVSWAWMESTGFFSPQGFNIDKNKVLFNDTREAKLNKIQQLRFDIFIDDLVEIFVDPGFPVNVNAMLFDPEKTAEQCGRYQVFNNWNDIHNAVFGQPN
jgi:hypothetical protein